MKALPAILSIAVVLLLAALSYEYQQAAHLQQLVAQMEKDASAARSQAESDAGDLRKLKEQVKSYKLSVTQLESINKQLNSGGAGAEKPASGEAAEEQPGQGGMMRGIAKMFSDPKMKGMLKAQQAAGVNMMYGDLAKELKLSPEEAKRVLEVLTERQFAMASEGMAAMEKGGGDAKALAESGKQSESVRAGYDAQLKNVLGNERFTQFQEYEKGMGERLALDQIQRQLSATGTPLEPTQAQGLLEIMKQERQKTGPSPFAAGNSNPAAQAQVLQSEAATDQWLQAQQDQNRRVLDRARSVLSPDQLLALENAQKQQVEMQQMGLKMSREFMKKSGK